MLFPLLASYYPLPVWLLVTIGCCSPYPFSLLIHLVVSVWRLTSQLCSRAADHHACSLAHWHRWLKQLALISWSPYPALWLCARSTLTFSVPISILITWYYTYLFSAKLRSGDRGLIPALRGLPAALDNDFSMNLPFSLPTGLCPRAINKTCIHG